MKIDRFILSSDANKNYLPFWPLVAKAWQEILGVRPTLALIASKDIHVDETFGDVIRFEPIDGVLTSLHAQVIRLFLPVILKMFPKWLKNRLSLFWDGKEKRFVKLGHTVNKRIDKIDWHYKDKKAEKFKYHDVALLRPYKNYKEEIDRLAKLMQLIKAGFKK